MLLVICVPTNVGFFTVASCVLPAENRKCIEAAIKVLTSWNPDWYPEFVMSDFSEAQIRAFENVFPGTYVVTFIVNYANDSINKWV